MKIIYKTDNNGVAVITPTQEALSMFADNKTGMLAIAEKDVPYNAPYKIIEDTDLPENREYRSAWEWDDTIEPDGFGGESNEFDAGLLQAYYALRGV